jgi:hypothetical protein
LAKALAASIPMIQHTVQIECLHSYQTSIG